MESDENMYRNGKLYQFDGSKFIELEPSTEIKVSISSEAMLAVKHARKASQAFIGMRPELSLTASAMLLAASELPNIAELVQQYGQRVYSNVSISITAND